MSKFKVKYSKMRRITRVFEATKEQIKNREHISELFETSTHIPNGCYDIGGVNIKYFKETKYRRSSKRSK